MRRDRRDDEDLCVFEVATSSLLTRILLLGLLRSQEEHRRELHAGCQPRHGRLREPARAQSQGGYIRFDSVEGGVHVVREMWIWSRSMDAWLKMRELTRHTAHLRLREAQPGAAAAGLHRCATMPSLRQGYADRGDGEHVCGEAGPRC